MAFSWTCSTRAMSLGDSFPRTNARKIRTAWREDFEAVAERLKGQEADLAVDDCLALAADFFSAAARIYTLAAMFPPPAQ